VQLGRCNDGCVYTPSIIARRSLLRISIWGLEAQEWEVLKRLDITYCASLRKPGNFLDSEEEVARYIQTLSPAGNNHGIAMQVASIVTKIVEYIIDASAFPKASVLMVPSFSLFKLPLLVEVIDLWERQIGRSKDGNRDSSGTTATPSNPAFPPFSKKIFVDVFL
jgi:hypothetical protein